MFRRIQKFGQSPMGRRFLMWLAPIIVGWVLSRLQGGSESAKSGRKSVKNKAK